METPWDVPLSREVWFLWSFWCLIAEVILYYLLSPSDTINVDLWKICAHLRSHLPINVFIYFIMNMINWSCFCSSMNMLTLSILIFRGTWIASSQKIGWVGGHVCSFEFWYIGYRTFCYRYTQFTHGHLHFPSKWETNSNISIELMHLLSWEVLSLSSKPYLIYLGSLGESYTLSLLISHSYIGLNYCSVCSLTCHFSLLHSQSLSVSL